MKDHLIAIKVIVNLPGISDHFANSLRRPLQVVQVNVHWKDSAAILTGQQDTDGIFDVEFEPAEVSSDGVQTARHSEQP